MAPAKDKEKEKEKEKEPEKKGGSKTLLIVLPIVLVVAGAGAYFFLSGDKAEEEAASEAEVAVAGSGKKMGPTFPITTFVVNLDEPGGTRYLKTTIELELARDFKEGEDKMQSRFRDNVIVYLSGLHVAEVQKADTKMKIKEKLLEMAQETFGKELVRSVLFNEFIVQ